MARRLGRLVAVAANTFRETVRERVLYNLVFFAVLMMLSGFLMKQLSIRQDEKIIKDVGLAAMELFGVLIAVFMGAGLVAKEMERRSLYPLLAKPLSRTEFFVGKFAGLAFTLLVNVSVMAAGMFLTLWLTGSGFDPQLLKAVWPLYLGLLLIVALTLFFSTLTSATLAAVFSVCLVLAGRYADVIRNMGNIVPGVSASVTKWLYLAIPNFANFDFKTRVTHGDPVSFADLGAVTLYGGLYIAFVLTAGALLFERKELK
jgi:ABC-type transport system involved in multi-copper enzyme maturation permease subunit